jgi:L-lactate dehydrogenase
MMRGVARELVLVDTQGEKARAEAMDLNHGPVFVPPVAITEGTIADCTGAHVVVITAGAKQQPGQSRLDLASVNAAVFRTLIPEVVKAAPKAHLLVVSIPWRVTGRGAESFPPVPVDQGKRAAFQRSAEVVRDVIKQLGF